MWCVATHLVLNSVDHVLARRKQRARRASARQTGCVEYGIGWRRVGLSTVLSPAREAEYGGGHDILREEKIGVSRRRRMRRSHVS